MSADREIPAEDSIKVVCRFRPLNDSEEKAGSKFVVKFPQGPEENCLSIGVSQQCLISALLLFSLWLWTWDWFASQVSHSSHFLCVSVQLEPNARAVPTTTTTTPVLIFLDCFLIVAGSGSPIWATASAPLLDPNSVWCHTGNHICDE